VTLVGPSARLILPGCLSQQVLTFRSAQRACGGVSIFLGGPGELAGGLQEVGRRVLDGGWRAEGRTLRCRAGRAAGRSSQASRGPSATVWLPPAGRLRLYTRSASGSTPRQAVPTICERQVTHPPRSVQPRSAKYRSGPTRPRTRLFIGDPRVQSQWPPRIGSGRLPKLDDVAVRVSQAREPAVGIGLGVNVYLDSGVA